MQGASKEEIYDELGLHSLTNRRWRNKLIFFYKILNGLLEDYLHSYFFSLLKKTIPSDKHHHLNLDHFHQKSYLLKIYFFLTP